MTTGKRRKRVRRVARPLAIRVFPEPGRPQRARVSAGNLAFPAALGRSGVTFLKREGDGATPAGRLGLLELRLRPDRTAGRPGPHPARITRPDDGWCDDPRDGSYNAPVRLPFGPSHERMWREDGLYDVVGILDWNLRPRIRRGGSAIFLHLARDGFRPTEGCIALRRGDLLRLLSATGRGAEFLVRAKPRRLGDGSALLPARHGRK